MGKVVLLISMEANSLEEATALKAKAEDILSTFVKAKVSGNYSQTV